DTSAGTIRIEDKTYPLRDRNFPTLGARPYDLSTEELTCLRAMRQSFLSSGKLWDQMQFLLSHGSMYVVRDDNLIFHGCVPVDDNGEFLSMPVDGQEERGKALFDALDSVLGRVLEQ